MHTVSEVFCPPSTGIPGFSMQVLSEEASMYETSNSHTIILVFFVNLYRITLSFDIQHYSIVGICVVSTSTSYILGAARNCVWLLFSNALLHSNLESSGQLAS